MNNKYWKLPEELWEMIEPLLPPEEMDKPKGGRPSLSDKDAMRGVMYRLRTGVQWEALPKEFGSGPANWCPVRV